MNYQSNHARAEEVVGAIGRAGGRAIAVAADIGIEEDVIRLFETVDRKLGPLHALVNNAGIMGPVGQTKDFGKRRGSCASLSDQCAWDDAMLPRSRSPHVDQERRGRRRHY